MKAGESEGMVVVKIDGRLSVNVVEGQSAARVCTLSTFAMGKQGTVEKDEFGRPATSLI